MNKYRSITWNVVEVLIAGCLLTAVSFQYIWQHEIIQFFEKWFVLAFLVVLCLVFPVRFAIAAVGFVFTVASALFVVNRIKIELMGFPLTYLDLVIFFRNPQGLFDALDAPVWSVYIFIFLIMLFAVSAVFWVYRLVLHYHTLWKRDGFSNILIAALTFCTVTGFLIISFSSFATSSHNRFLEEHPFWRVDGVIKHSQQIGAMGFIVYSFHANRLQTGDYFNHRLSVSPPSQGQVKESVLQFVNFGMDRSDLLPNIILIFAESTFNPSDVFNLTDPIPDGSLFGETQYTHAIGPLYVNPVGGGSWISEFESLTGLDARLFGFWGYYTHASLSPLIKSSLVTYLRKRSYQTTAYYSADGDFYNARNAFINYGFDTFLDIHDLENISGWGERDDKMANAVIAHSLANVAGPFFKFVSFSGNHAPHRCRNFKSADEFITRFAGTDDFEYNCVLNEFIRDTQFTSKGFEKLLTYLKDIEERTGRPYVALVYGDHQPHTFTGTGGDRWHWGEIRDYRPFRRLDERHTFFHLVSSLPRTITCCEDAAPHLTLVPSILSAYVASMPEEVYLGINFYKYKHCGSDFMRFGVSRLYDTESQLDTGALDMGAGYLMVRSNRLPEKRCAVYNELLSAYRNLDIM